MLSALKPKNAIFTCLKYKYMTSILQQRAFSRYSNLELSLPLLYNRTRSERNKYDDDDDDFPTENG